MTLDTALRATEILMALAFMQQSAEHLVGPRRDRWLHLWRIAFSAGLVSGALPVLWLAALAGASLALLHRHHGPYNGGSDRMGLLILWCLLAAHIVPWPLGRELALGYLALQVTLSYFMAGKVKLVNPEWRSGRALSDVFAFSAYPVAEDMRALADRTALMRATGWGVIAFELLFPLALISQITLIAALITAACFHLLNALFLGLNRFFWIWIAAYPSLIWLQVRLS